MLSTERKERHTQHTHTYIHTACLCVQRKENYLKYNKSARLLPSVFPNSNDSINISDVGRAPRSLISHHGLQILGLGHSSIHLHPPLDPLHSHPPLLVRRHSHLVSHGHYP